MTLFEYLAIAFSLVLSFSAMRLVAGLPYATQRGQYWVHLVFVLSQLLVTVVAFWNLWSFREATWTLTLGSFSSSRFRQGSVNQWKAQMLFQR